MDAVIIIPATNNDFSLRQAGEKTVLEHTIERALQTGFKVIVASGHVAVTELLHFNFHPEVSVVNVYDAHTTGTSRICAALAKYIEKERHTPQVVINWQSTEPRVEARAIVQMVDLMAHHDHQINTLVYACEDAFVMHNSRIVKAILQQKPETRVLHFTREPYRASSHYFVHVGVYAFRRRSLMAVADLHSRASRSQRLEQEGWIHHGNTVDAVVCNRPQVTIRCDDAFNEFKALIASEAKFEASS